MTSILFVHGKDCRPTDARIRTLSAVVRTLGFTTATLDLSESDESNASADHLSDFSAKLPTPRILVGAGLAGYACAIAALRVDVRALFLISPAIGLPGQLAPCPPPPCHVEIVHGWHDETVAVATVIDWAIGARAWLHVIDDEHGLRNNLPWLGETFASLLKRAFALANH